MMQDAEWFVIKSGVHEGLIHMAGWKFSAHLGTPTGPHGDPWLGFGSCPRCGAMVLNNGDAYISKEVQLHNAWHSNTDHPIPPELNAEQDQIYRALSTP